MLKSLITLLCISAFSVSGYANADKVKVDTTRVYDIEEVTVYDQPKEFSFLRQQPLSSTSFHSSNLNRLGVTDLRGISNYVPSLVMPAYGSRLTPAIYMRGIGSRANAPAVGLYIDGMPMICKTAFNTHLYDIDRVDILRGAQGTLYGINTEGGIVRMFTKNPLNYNGTDIKLSAGNKLYRNFDIANYGRFTDNLGYSISAFYTGQNGFFVNKFNGEKADLINEFGGRGRLSWKANNRLNFDLIADYQHVNQKPSPFGEIVTEEQVATAKLTSPYFGLKPGTQQPNHNRENNYKRDIINTGLGIKYKGNGFMLSSMTSWQNLNDCMLMDADYLPQDFFHYKQTQNHNSLFQELSLKGGNSNKWHWTIGAVASYQWMKTNTPVYFDSEMNKNLSRFASMGAYTGILNKMVARIAQKLIAKGKPAEIAEKEAKVMAIAAIAKAGGVNIKMKLDPIAEEFKTPNFNFGVFHESNIKLGSRLRATLGLRYDYSHTSIEYATTSKILIDGSVMGRTMKAIVSSNLNNTENNKFNQLLPKIGLTYELHNGSNIYAIWQKGYRAGGYNIEMFGDIMQGEIMKAAQGARGNIDIKHDDAAYRKIAETISYKPEISFNYEVGAHLNLMKGQLKIDLAAYYIQVRNQQLSVMATNYGLGRTMTNAGKSHSCGFEAMFRGIALKDRLNYTFSYGFTNAVFDEYSETKRGKLLNYKGNRIPFIPQSTLSATADYYISVDPKALLNPKNKFHLRGVTLGADLSAQGNTYWNNTNTLSQNFYALLGAHANGDFGPMSINVWIKNLTDTKYNTFVIQSAATGKNYTFGQLGNPFQMGIDIAFHL